MGTLLSFSAISAKGNLFCVNNSYNDNRLYLQRVIHILVNTNLPCGPLLNAVTG